MATVNKDFKIKYGLIVEGTTATVNSYDILTKSAADQSYIVGLIGGTATSLNTINTVVKRDGTGSFAAGTITAETKFVGDLEGNVTGDVTGTVSDISNHTTSDLAEGTNQYFTTTRARESIQPGTGINYDSATGTVSIDSTTTATKSYVDGEISNVDLAAQGYATTAENNAKGYADSLSVNYDPAGAASTAQTNAENFATDAVNAHNDLTSGVHGVTGDVVGTSDAQSLSNKTFMGQTNFQSAGGAGGTANHIDVDSSTGKMTVTSGYALDITAQSDIAVTSNAGDIVLNPSGGAYITSVSAGNEIATNAYVDNAVSGLTWKQSVNVLAVANVPLTGSTPLSVDSHTLSDGYRVLLTAQSTNSENGIYDLSITGGSYTLSRSADADAFGELVGAAVFVMEGTAYNNTSWVQSNHYLTDFSSQSWTQFSGSGSVVAGTGITVDGLEVSIDRTTVDTWYDAAGDAADALTSANSYTDGEITTALSTAQGYANTAEGNANSYTDGKILTEVSDRNSAITSAINALTTSDIEEGTNLYFTSDRATDAAGSLLANAVKTNIQITYDSGTNALAITAENGVADSTTDDLDEGSTNLYFTNARAQSAVAGDISSAIDALTTDDIEEGTSHLYFTDVRAVDALEAVVPNFTEVDINSLATQIAATTSVPTASQVPVYSFAKADYRSAEFLVKTAYGNHTEISKVLVTLDVNDNIAITEYGTIGTNGASMTISADIDGLNVRLLVTTANNTSTVTVVGTLLA